MRRTEVTLGFFDKATRKWDSDTNAKALVDIHGEIEQQWNHGKLSS